tara:strand:- start:172 stop:426 length:255 start_codon:yes stop_codon:yes gene_type:complete
MIGQVIELALALRIFLSQKRARRRPSSDHSVGPRLLAILADPPNLYRRHLTSLAFVDELRVIQAVIVCVASTTPAPLVHVVEPI